MNADARHGWGEPWRRHARVLQEYVRELREYIAELEQGEDLVNRRKQEGV